MKKEFSVNEIKEIANDILVQTNKMAQKTRATVVLMYGDLGSGKTTLSKQIAKLLKVKENLISPTFVIMKKYKTKNENFKNLIHVDAYRLEGFSDLEKIGFKEWILDKNNLIIIEWPQKVFKKPNKDFLKIYLKHKSENLRLLEIKNKQ